MNKNTYILISVILVLGIIFWVFPSSKTEKIAEEEVARATVAVIAVNSDKTLVKFPDTGGESGEVKNINWQTSNYPVDAGVNINLVRKISDSPREFALVRTIETDTLNDGKESWVPQAGENLGDLYVEVTCSNDYQFKVGCSISSEPIKIN